MKIINLTLKNAFYFLIISIFIFNFMPSRSSAAFIYSSSENMTSKGDTAIINVFLNTESELINSLDGSIILSDNYGGNFEVKDISLVGSSFSIWPRSPSLEEGHKIYFVGGVPGGINNERALLFKIIVKINESGDFSIKPDTVTAYLNDGLATQRNITSKDSVISINQPNGSPIDRWQEIISNDNIAPEPFKIDLIKDSNLFDGKKFISFEAFDLQSGIDHYEVKEGDYPSVRTGTNYILINQKGDPKIIVTAYDKAGNFQVSTLGQKESINWFGIIISVAIIFIAYNIIKRLFKKDEKK